MDIRKSIPDGASALAAAKTTFETVAELEDPVAITRDIVTGLSMIAETLETQEGSVVQRLSWLALKQLEIIEEERGKLFHLTHPYVYGTRSDADQAAS